MTNNSPLNRYSFHPLIAEVYSEVHDWLRNQSKFSGYKKIISYAHCNDRTQPFQSAAFQYWKYFPAHYFKVIHTLDKIITPENLLRGLGRNSHICLVDLGCGAGTASLAFLETIIRLQEQNKLKHKLEIYFLAVDANPATLVIYYKSMLQIQEKIDCSQINLTYQICPCPIKEVFSPSRVNLQQVREEWKLPVLPLVFMMHSTVVDFLNTQHKLNLHRYDELIKLGINPERIATYNSSYSIDYALAYRLILEEVPIDNLSLITIGTSSDNQLVKEMSEALDKIFAAQHETIRFGDPSRLQNVLYCNPSDSYWREARGRIHYDSEFFADVTTIINCNFKEDQDWHKVTSMDNLELAWVRARKHLLNESLCDEVELRLFEKDLGKNLNRLQVSLVAYVKEVDHEHDYISYPFPKKTSEARWRGLSRLEEEIFSVAIIQKLGNKVAELRGSSYAYRMTREPGNKTTEYLYSSWFGAYKNFVNDACLAAEKYKNCVIIRADIKSFYTHIIQDKLISLVSQELTESKRIRWLLRLLLSKKMNEHDLGAGVTQGHIGSGFYANVYLTSIDMKFGSNNEWGLKFFRYVDDMIIVIPDPEDEKDVLEQLKKELQEIGLELNEDKTEIFHSVSDFLEICSEDEDLFNEFR